MQPRFHDGVYLGRRMESNESLIGLKDGTVVKCRDFREVSDDVAFNAELLKIIKGTSFDPTNTMPPHLPGDESTLPVPPQLRSTDPSERATRGFIIRDRHCNVAGYSDGCLKCRMMQRGVRSSEGHNAECRARILK